MTTADKSQGVNYKWTSALNKRCGVKTKKKTTERLGRRSEEVYYDLLRSEN